MIKKYKNVLMLLARVGNYEINSKGTVTKKNAHDRLTYENSNKLLYFHNLFEKINTIEGDIVECGVANGRTLSYLIFLNKRESNRKRKIWAFDSFSGLPSPTKEDGNSVGFRGKFNFAMNEVIEFLKSVGVDEVYIQSQMRFIPGFFNESLKQYVGPGIAFLHIDVDLFQSYMDVLENLYDKVVPGGIIAFDEYLATDELAAYPGAHAAINQFLGEKKNCIQSDPITGKSFFVKK